MITGTGDWLCIRNIDDDPKVAQPAVKMSWEVLPLELSDAKTFGTVATTERHSESIVLVRWFDGDRWLYIHRRLLLL